MGIVQPTAVPDLRANLVRLIETGVHALERDKRAMMRCGARCSVKHAKLHAAGQLFEEVREEQDDAQDPEITGTDVAEAVVPIVYHADAGPKARLRRADAAPWSGLSPATTILVSAANVLTRALRTEVEVHSSRPLVFVRSHARSVGVLGVGLADGIESPTAILRVFVQVISSRGQIVASRTFGSLNFLFLNSSSE